MTTAGSTRWLAGATWIAIAVAIGVVGFGVAACTPPHLADAPLPPPDPDRLSHASHAKIACTECHAMGERPGRDHQPCVQCHRDAFMAAPSALCRICHVRVTADPLAAPLRAYPSDDVWRAQSSLFSHARHLDAPEIERRVGFHVTCNDCHERDAKLARPDHATCARCHADEVALEGAPRMSGCASCHRPATVLRTRARLIRGDLRFEHERHREDRRGQRIACDSCHRDSARATGYADHAAPRVESCVGCHDDSDRTPPSLAMRSCETCHTTRAERLTSIAPRSHLPATERPLDHTIAFRRDHGDAAEHAAARCATCHTQMSGNAHDACDECHQTMRPVDHNITFRELDHGAESAADRQRCARCHVIEFCTACHSQRPRSHGVPGSFTHDHGGLARVNVRSCLTCHDEVRDCETAGCHASARGRR